MSDIPRITGDAWVPRDMAANAFPRLPQDEIDKLEARAAFLPIEFDTVPVCKDYATKALHEGHNLPVLFEHLRADGVMDYGSKYGVIYRSSPRLEVPEGSATDQDHWAHLEARLSQGYEYYCKGPIWIAGQCLSFCFWKEARQAQQASKAQAHVLARGLAPYLYNESIIEFIDVVYQEDGIAIVNNRPPHRIDHNNNVLLPYDGFYKEPVFVPIGPEPSYPKAA